MKQLDMFAPPKHNGGRYPNKAGFKEPAGTSQAAAERIEASGRALTIRDRLWALFEAGETHTIYTAGRKLGVSQFSVRPRFSELSEQGKIRKKWQTAGEAGASVWVWGRA